MLMQIGTLWTNGQITVRACHALAERTALCMLSPGTDDPARPAQLEQYPHPTVAECRLVNLHCALLQNRNTKCHAVMTGGKAGQYQKQHHHEAVEKEALQGYRPGERHSSGGLSDTK